MRENSKYGLLKDETASVAVEFSISILLVLTVAFAVVDLSRIYITDSILQTALRNTIQSHRIALPIDGNTIPISNIGAAEIRQAIAHLSKGFLDPERILPGNPVNVAGLDVTKYVVTYELQFATPFLSLLTSDSVRTRLVSDYVPNGI